MILSHKLKLLFIAVPKTGTHAIRFALREHLDEEDEEQVGLFVEKRFSHPDIAEVRHGHLKAIQLKKVLSDEVWNQYFKFAVVRNPWDKYVSFCTFMNRNNPHFKKDPQHYLHQIIDRPKARKRILFRPQYEFLCDDNGEIMVDFVGRFEALQSTYDEVANKVGIAPRKLDKVNASEHDHYRSYYDEELKEKVGEFYQKDIELFQYTF